MGIMDMFKIAPQQQQTQPQQTQQQTIKSQPDNPTNPGTLPGANPNDPAKSTESPLDSYQKMFDNASKNSDIQAPNFSIDPTVLADVSSRMDFTKGINPELIQKASSGDINAMMQVIQEVGRNSYRASLEHTTKLTDTHLGQRSEYETKRLQQGVKQQLTSDALASNANYKHPVVAAELNRIAKQFQNSPEYADATPQEIAEAAKNYLNEINSAMNPKDPKKDSAGNNKPAEIDYTKYILG